MSKISNVFLNLFFLTTPFYCHSSLMILACESSLTINNPGNYKLPEKCNVIHEIKISKSDVSLNCQNNQIDGMNIYNTGILIGGEKNKIQNVVVSNCRINNAKNNGIRITSGFKMNELYDDHSQNYSNAPSAIKLYNNSIVNSGKVGIYIDSYSYNIDLINNKIISSQGSGVYLEQASKNNLIKDNYISNNGYSTTRNSFREGLSIDSSSNNRIINNTFSENAAGGVFIYKNCGEHFSSGNSVLRWQPSEKNLIQNNVFKEEKIGVWIASRQRRNLSKWDCGDRSIGNQRVYYQDYADYNSLLGNSFTKVDTGVIVESSNNTIENNSFISSDKSILLPEKDIFAKTKYQIRDNNIKNNQIKP